MAGDAITINIKDDKYILIYRILVIINIIIGINFNCCFVSFIITKIIENKKWINKFDYIPKILNFINMLGRIRLLLINEY